MTAADFMAWAAANPWPAAVAWLGALAFAAWTLS